jgi:hypothetical protein
MVMKIPAGLDGVPSNTIPEDPKEFVNWFKSVGIKRWLAAADVRNAIQGLGISITGAAPNPATISAMNIPLSSLAMIANDTVIGNVSGVTAIPAALTQAQLTSLINVSGTDAMSYFTSF